MPKFAAHFGVLLATLAYAAHAQQTPTPMFQPLPQSQQPASSTQSAPAAAPSDPDNNPFAAAVRAMAARRNPVAAAPGTDAPTPAPAPAAVLGTWGKPLGAAKSATPAAPLASKPAPAKPAAGVLAESVAITQPAADPSPADKPAAAASITFQEGLLTVHAYNSSLTQILRDLAAKTGMQMDGVPTDERVFGDFGPAPVTKVLAQLLDGGPSNYVVFGMNDDHAPRSLVISPRDSLSPADVAANNHVGQQTMTEDDDDEETPVAQPMNLRPLMQPQNAIAPPPAARTPQEILDEMQHRREQEQQQ